MPDKRAYSQSVGKTVVRFSGPWLSPALVAGSAALFAAGCTDNSGNGHFIPPGSDAAAGAGGGGRRQRRRRQPAAPAAATAAVAARAATARRRRRWQRGGAGGGGAGGQRHRAARRQRRGGAAAATPTPRPRTPSQARVYGAGASRRSRKLPPSVPLSSRAAAPAPNADPAPNVAGP